MLILPAWILVSCYTTIDRQNYRFSEAESVSDSRAYRDDVPDLPVSSQLLASIPEYSNTLVLEGTLANFYSLRDFAVDQHHTICLYDPIDGVLGIRKEVPQSGLEMIMFYRISGRIIKANAYWRKLSGRGSVSQNMIDTLIRSAVENEHTPTMWASADRTGSAGRPVRRSDNPDSSEVNRGRVVEPRNTGNPERRSGQDESSRRRDGEARQTHDRRTNDTQGRENRRDDRGEKAPSVTVYPMPSPPHPEPVRSSAPWMPTISTTSRQLWKPAMLQEDVFSDRSVAFAHMLHFIHQSPYEDNIRYQYIRLDHVLPADDPCNIEPRYFW